MVCFTASRLDNQFEELKELKQLKFIEDYIFEFELHSFQRGWLLEMQFLGYFVGGLHHAICSRVRTFKPQFFYQAMQLACDVEAGFTN